MVVILPGPNDEQAQLLKFSFAAFACCFGFWGRFTLGFTFRCLVRWAERWTTCRTMKAETAQAAIKKQRRAGASTKHRRTGQNTKHEIRVGDEVNGTECVVQPSP
eukprot:754754-Prymnesium_polylepis.1